MVHLKDRVLAAFNRDNSDMNIRIRTGDLILTLFKDTVDDATTAQNVYNVLVLAYT